jgi:ATP-dependent DNA helicase 2 subunit 1
MSASIPFRLGPPAPTNSQSTDVQMSVYVYSMYLETKKPTAVKVDRETNREVVAEVQHWTKGSGTIVKANQMAKKFKFGSEEIILSNDGLKASKQFEEPALTLLGFKPRSAIKTHLQKRPAHFIYPNENAVKGSTTLFNALLRRCTQRDKIPICRITLRRRSAPNIVALFPQLECKPLVSLLINILI